MRPSFAQAYVGNQGLGNPVLSRDLALRNSSNSANGDDVSLRKFGIPVLRTANVRLTSFGYLVGHIVCIGPREKMFWIDAYRVVAAMQNLQIIWYWSAVNFVRNAVCSFRSFPIPKLTVAITCIACRPLPTASFGVGFCLGKQSLLEHLFRISSHERNLP